MTATTHVLGRTWHCQVCKKSIPFNPGKSGDWKTGDRIGVLESKWASPVSYKVGEKDCNQPCGEVGKP